MTVDPLHTRTLSETRDESGEPTLEALPCLLHVLDRTTIQQCPELSLRLLPGVPVTFGRGSESAVVDGGAKGCRVALADGFLSREHATLTLEDSDAELSARVVDHGSRNGTFVNGARVTEIVLREGERFSVGAHTFLLRRMPAAVVALLGTSQSSDRQYLGQSPSCLSLVQLLGRVASAPISVLLEGATGTGKEVLARELHARSGRRGRFVGINCGSIPDNLIESELFGYKRGAFSGANQAKEGLLTAADGGTILLDEIGDMPHNVQVRLLRVLQEGEVLPLGATRPEKVDVRVVAATHRDLEARVESEDFRADLYARLRGLRVHVPALQERPEDVGLLFAEGVRRTGAAPGALRLSRAAASALLACPWPHNVRQVMQVAATAVVLAEDGVIREEHLQGLSELQSVASSAGTVPTDPISTLVLAARHRQKDPERFREALLAVLAHVEGNLSRAAKETGFSRMQFYRWLETYGIER